MNKWYSGATQERVLKVDVNSIKASKHIREIFDIEGDELREHDNESGRFAKANKLIIIKTLNDPGNKKTDRINQLCDFQINSEELKFKVNPTCKLKKVPTKVTNSSIKPLQTNNNIQKEGSSEISKVNNINNIVSKNKSQLSFTASTITQANSQDVIGSNSNKDSSKANMDIEEIFYVPCINCNNIIRVDSIEAHSDVCLTIKDEVKQVEQSKFSYHLVDFKLKKLKDHFQSMKELKFSKNEKDSDTEILETLLTTTKDAICTAKIAVASINLLKKLIIGIDVSIF